MHKNFKFLHISDVHLGTIYSKDTIVGKDSDKRRQELWITFQRTLDYALDQGADFVLIAGDLFENASFTVSNIDRLAYIFQQYKALDFYIVGGNHDFISPKYNYLESVVGANVHLFDSKLSFVEINQLNVRIYGYTWDRVEIEELPFEYPELNKDYFNILLLHTDAQNPSHHLPIIKEELVAVGFDYCAFGHIHYNHEIFKNAYFSGSPEPLKFTNTGEHGALLGSYTNGVLDVSFKELGTRQYRDYNFNLDKIESNISAIALLESMLEEAKRGDYIRITALGKRLASIDLAELEDRIQEKFKYSQIIDNSFPSEDVEILLENNRDNIVGEYIKYVTENYDSDSASKLIDICMKGLITGDNL